MKYSKCMLTQASQCVIGSLLPLHFIILQMFRAPSHCLKLATFLNNPVSLTEKEDWVT